MKENQEYYSVMPSDGIARVFNTKKEACDFAQEQLQKYNITGMLLLTCTVGIESDNDE